MLDKVPRAISSFKLWGAIVTNPFFLLCLNCIWLPFCLIRNHPSFSRIFIISLNFIYIGFIICTLIWLYFMRIQIAIIFHDSLRLKALPFSWKFKPTPQLRSFRYNFLRKSLNDRPLPLCLPVAECCEATYRSTGCWVRLSSVTECPPEADVSKWSKHRSWVSVAAIKPKRSMHRPCLSPFPAHFDTISFGNHSMTDPGLVMPFLVIPQLVPSFHCGIGNSGIHSSCLLPPCLPVAEGWLDHRIKVGIIHRWKKKELHFLKFLLK